MASLLEGFRICGNPKEKPFLTLRNNNITFSKSSIDLLGNPAYVHAYIDEKNEKYAIQPCEKEALAFPFYAEPKEGKQVLVRWANKERISDLTQMLDMEKYPKGARIYGTYYQKENIIIYDLKTAVTVR